MKRNVKNEKVLRAMAIGLATMIAVTSTPVTVLADATDNEEPVVNDEPTDPDNPDEPDAQGGDNPDAPVDADNPDAPGPRSQRGCRHCRQCGERLGVLAAVLDKPGFLQRDHKECFGWDFHRRWSAC